MQPQGIMLVTLFWLKPNVSHCKDFSLSNIADLDIADVTYVSELLALMLVLLHYVLITVWLCPGVLCSASR